MNALRNNRGSVMIFATLMLVLLIIMVGMGLDAGWLAYVRSQGQPAVDSAALAGATGLIVGESEVYNRVSAFNGTNDYVDQSNTMLGSENVTPIFYDGTLISPAAYGTANGVRVALETAGSNPYDGSNAETSIMSPLFLTPLMNLFGNIIPTSADVNVSAVAVMMRRPELPFTIVECEVGAFTASWSQTPSTSDNSAFTSFTLSSANVNTMRDMVSSSCGTIPVVGLESCINLNNGQDTPVLQEMIKAFGPFSDPPDDPDDCFLIPVIPNVPEGGNLNQCRHIQSLARLCITSVNAPGQPNFSPPMTVSGQITDCNVPIYGVTSCSVPVLVRDTQSGM